MGTRSRNQISIGSATNSAVQIKSPGAIQNVQVQQAGENAADILAALANVLDRLELPPDARQQISADVASAQAELAAPSPRPRIVGEFLRGIRDTLADMANTAAAAASAAIVHGFVERINAYLSG